MADSDPDQIKNLYKSFVTFILQNLTDDYQLKNFDLETFPDLSEKDQKETDSEPLVIDFKRHRQQFVCFLKNIWINRKKADDSRVVLQKVWELRRFVKTDYKTFDVSTENQYNVQLKVLLAIEDVLNAKSPQTATDVENPNDEDFEHISKEECRDVTAMEVDKDESKELVKRWKETSVKLIKDKTDLFVELEELKNKFDIIKQENLDLQQRINKYEKGNTGQATGMTQSKIRDKIAELEKDIEKRKKENQTLTHRLKDCEEERNKLSKERTETQKKFDKCKQEYKECIEKAEELNEIIQKFKEANVNITTEKADISLKCSQYEEAFRRKDIENEENRNKYLQYKEAYSKLHREKGNLDAQYLQYKEAYSNLHREKGNLEAHVSHLNKQIDSIKKEKDSLMQRLSMVAGMKMKDNNPGIADLSDPNRPEKLSEQFRELYDNGWTDVLDALGEQNESEEANVKEILGTIQIIYKACRDLVQNRKNTMLIALGYEDGSLQKDYDGGRDGHDPDIKIVKDLLRKSAKRLSSFTSMEIQKNKDVKDFVRMSGKDGDEFVKKCTEIIIYMVLQDPPMVLDFAYDYASKFDKDLLASFTKSGNFIKYLVWPVMYLHQNGPLMSKGVAQGMTRKIIQETVVQNEQHAEESKEITVGVDNDKQLMDEKDVEGKVKALNKPETSNVHGENNADRQPDKSDDVTDRKKTGHESILATNDEEATRADEIGENDSRQTRDNNAEDDSQSDVQSPPSQNDSKNVD